MARSSAVFNICCSYRAGSFRFHQCLFFVCLFLFCVFPLGLQSPLLLLFFTRLFSCNALLPHWRFLGVVVMQQMGTFYNLLIKSQPVSGTVSWGLAFMCVSVPQPSRGIGLFFPTVSAPFLGFSVCNLFPWSCAPMTVFSFSSQVTVLEQGRIPFS